jgi:hypothetical protein
MKKQKFTSESRVWWYMTVILALGSQRQEDGVQGQSSVHNEGLFKTQQDFFFFGIQLKMIEVSISMSLLLLFFIW